MAKILILVIFLTFALDLSASRRTWTPIGHNTRVTCGASRQGGVQITFSVLDMDGGSGAVIVSGVIRGDVKCSDLELKEFSDRAKSDTKIINSCVMENDNKKITMEHYSAGAVARRYVRAVFESSRPASNCFLGRGR